MYLNQSKISKRSSQKIIILIYGVVPLYIYTHVHSLSTLNATFLKRMRELSTAFTKSRIKASVSDSSIYSPLE